MNKTILFALPLVALLFAVGCSKQEAAPAAMENAPSPEEAPAAAPVVAPAAAPDAEKTH